MTEIKHPSVETARQKVHGRLGRVAFQEFESELARIRKLATDYAEKARLNMSDDWFAEGLDRLILPELRETMLLVVPPRTLVPSIEHEFRQTVGVSMALDARQLASEIFAQRRSDVVAGKLTDPWSAKDYPAPDKQLFGVSAEGAERLCAEWMKHLGASDVLVTRATADGGIDLIADPYIAQVKNYAGTVGVIPVRELAGVASIQNREALFFTSGTYASGAIDFANQAQIALFAYNAEEGTLQGINPRAVGLLVTGL
jgi:hypothetical protein